MTGQVSWGVYLVMFRICEPFLFIDRKLSCISYFRISKFSYIELSLIGDFLYKEWKRRVRRLIEESKRRVDEEFGRKLSQNFSVNKKLFWKVKKVRGGERSGDVRMRGQSAMMG